MTKNNLQTSKFDNDYIRWYSHSRMFIQSGHNNYQNLFPILVKYQLDKNIRNVSNVYLRNLREIHNLQLDLKIYRASFFILIFIILNMIVFMTLTYLEDKKKQHAIYYIQGIPFLLRHSEYLLINLSLILLAYIVVSAIFHISWMIGIIYIISEILRLLVVISSYQRVSIIDTLKNG